jgi:uncharacterized protein (TIGR02594 family)
MDDTSLPEGVLTGGPRMDEMDWTARLQDSFQDASILAVPDGTKILPPDAPEWQDAKKILEDAPTGVVPYQIAEYFITQVPEKYQEAWPQPDPSHPTYANPVIVAFFLATNLKPAGDTTAWCAAFVNWCLHRAGLPTTKSASSQSFVNQDWGQVVWSKADGPRPIAAQQGDVAVFRRRSDPAHGHVCFFKQISTQQARHIDVLGGNQIRRGIHLIDFDTLPVDADLELYSIRTMNGLRNV